jgi:hypothetical protein
MSPVVKLYVGLCKRGLYLTILLLMACGGTEKAPLENS